MLAARPQHDAGNGEKCAEKEPVEGIPIPRSAGGSVVEKIGIKNAGAIGKFDEIGSDVEGTPDEKIREKKGDVKEIAEIFVG